MNNLVKMLKRKGVAISHLAHELNIDQSSFNRRLKKGHLNLDEIIILRAKIILTLEDIEEMTRP